MIIHGIYYCHAGYIDIPNLHTDWHHTEIHLSEITLLCPLSEPPPCILKPDPDAVAPWSCPGIQKSNSLIGCRS